MRCIKSISSRSLVFELLTGQLLTQRPQLLCQRSVHRPVCGLRRITITPVNPQAQTLLHPRFGIRIHRTSQRRRATLAQSLQRNESEPAPIRTLLALPPGPYL